MSSPIQIDKGIPMPSRREQYPFAEMEIGDSFFHTGLHTQVRSAACIYGARNHKRFSVRTVTENGVDGVRTWRTA